MMHTDQHIALNDTLSARQHHQSSPPGVLTPAVGTLPAIFVGDDGTSMTATAWHAVTRLAHRVAVTVVERQASRPHHA